MALKLCQSSFYLSNARRCGMNLGRGCCTLVNDRIRRSTGFLACGIPQLFGACRHSGRIAHHLCPWDALQNSQPAYRHLRFFQRLLPNSYLIGWSLDGIYTRLNRPRRCRTLCTTSLRREHHLPTLTPTGILKKGPHSVSCLPEPASLKHHRIHGCD